MIFFRVFSSSWSLVNETYRKTCIVVKNRGFAKIWQSFFPYRSEQKKKKTMFIENESIGTGYVRTVLSPDIFKNTIFNWKTSFFRWKRNQQLKEKLVMVIYLDFQQTFFDPILKISQQERQFVWVTYRKANRDHFYILQSVDYFWNFTGRSADVPKHFVPGIFNRCRIRELLNHFSTTTSKNIYRIYEI